MPSPLPAKHTIRVIVAYFFIYVVWGSTYFFIGVALKGLPPFLLGAIRFSFAGLLLLIWCIMRGERVFRKELLIKSAISGIVLLFVDMAVVMLAQQYISSSLVAIIAASTALWILLLDIPMWKTNFRRWTVTVGVFIGFAGVILLYLEQTLMQQSGSKSEYGVILSIIGCISWALGTLYAKYRSSSVEGQNAMAGTAWQMISASLMFWICTFFSGGIGRTDFSIIPATTWYSLIYLIIFGSIFAYSSYIWLLKVRPTSEVSTHAYVNPVIAAILGSMLGNENVTLIQISGMMAILFSVMMINRRRQEPRDKKQENRISSHS